MSSWRHHKLPLVVLERSRVMCDSKFQRSRPLWSVLVPITMPDRFATAPDYRSYSWTAWEGCRALGARARGWMIATWLNQWRHFQDKVTRRNIVACVVHWPDYIGHMVPEIILAHRSRWDGCLITSEHALAEGKGYRLLTNPATS